MSYRAFSGPKGSTTGSVFDKEHMLYKEFESLDAALAWARHIIRSGRVALLIEGDDGTNMDKLEIAAALNHSETANLRTA